jgi:hypothetical protein
MESHPLEPIVDGEICRLLHTYMFCFSYRRHKSFPQVALDR